jgi:hypothetical protein
VGPAKDCGIKLLTGLVLGAEESRCAGLADAVEEVVGIMREEVEVRLEGGDALCTDEGRPGRGGQLLAGFMGVLT